MIHMTAPKKALNQAYFNRFRGRIMNPVVHFEMPYDNRERMARFYEVAFGWRTRMLGKDLGNYVLATTTETDENGPKRPGAINGGFSQKSPIGPRNIPPSLSRWKISTNR